MDARQYTSIITALAGVVALAGAIVTSLTGHEVPDPLWILAAACLGVGGWAWPTGRNQ